MNSITFINYEKDKFTYPSGFQFYLDINKTKNLGDDFYSNLYLFLGIADEFNSKYFNNEKALNTLEFDNEKILFQVEGEVHIDLLKSNRVEISSILNNKKFTLVMFEDAENNLHMQINIINYFYIV